MSRSKSGFTIVELLIVIVVIAILAAISIVAYNGIQERARKSAQASQLIQTEKEIMTWALQKNGESISLSNTLVGYQIGAGQNTLLRPIAGAADITMYVAYEVIDTTGNYNSIAQLESINYTTQSFVMNNHAAGSASIGYRMDTSVQSNVTAYQPNLRIPGSKVSGWLQTSSNATVRSLGYNQAQQYHVGSLSSHASWNFTGLRTFQSSSGTALAALIFVGAHDQATRAQVLGWISEKYGTPAP